MYRTKVNEKLVGGALIALGLGGLLVGFRLNPDRSPYAALRDAPVESSRLAARNLAPESQTSTGVQANGERQSCRVLTVYDGDTIACDLDGDGRVQRPTEVIRLLGIDTPERNFSRKNASYGSANPTDEPFSKQSSAWMERQVSGKTMYLEYDLRKQDRYGRTLAFVYTSAKAKTSLNLQAVEQGYAKKLFLGKNRLYEDEFTEAEQQARQAKRGLWSITTGDLL